MAVRDTTALHADGARAVEGDVPAALVRLDRMVDALEKYVRIQAPNTDRDEIESQSEVKS